jgi:hypothetical protein
MVMASGIDDTEWNLVVQRKMHEKSFFSLEKCDFLLGKASKRGVFPSETAPFSLEKGPEKVRRTCAKICHLPKHYIWRRRHFATYWPDFSRRMSPFPL